MMAANVAMSVSAWASPAIATRTAYRLKVQLHCCGGYEPLIEDELFAHSYQSGIVAKRSLQRQGFRVQKPGKCVDLLIGSMCSPKSRLSLVYEILRTTPFISDKILSIRSIASIMALSVYLLV